MIQLTSDTVYLETVSDPPGKGLSSTGQPSPQFQMPIADPGWPLCF